MANEQLKTALVKADLEPEDLAARIQVDPKSVQRWIGGKVIPRPRYRAKVADVLGVPERQLWPDQADNQGPRDDRADLVAVYASASDVRAPDWRVMLYDARDHVDLLDTTLAEVIGAAGVTDVLKTKADAGCQINVLIAHPKSIWVSTLAQQLGQDQPDEHGDTPLDRQLSRSHKQLQQIADHPNIDGRTFWAERTNSILRFDNQMLVSLHLQANDGTDAPLLHLRRDTDDGLFDQFARHLDTIRQHASDPLEINPDIPLAHPDGDD